MLRRMAVAMFACAGGVASDQLVEVAALAFRSLVLIHEREAVLVECLEPLVPGDFLQRSCSAVSREIEPDHPCIISGSRPFDTRRFCSARLCPLADFLVIGGGMAGM